MIIGIDPSINCTGVCLNWSDHTEYYMIPSKMTKKMKIFNHDRIRILPYEKHEIKNLEYSQKESAKTYNIYSICQHIKSILEAYRPELVIMEGVSYGSTGSAALVDLSGLQFAIRMVIMNLGIPFKIVSPTSVKKFAVANGQAEKDIIIDAWKRMDPDIGDIKDIKVDDLADSYFISCYRDNV